MVVVEMFRNISYAIISEKTRNKINEVYTRGLQAMGRRGALIQKNSIATSVRIITVMR
jgi:hypothetical protein